MKLDAATGKLVVGANEISAQTSETRGVADDGHTWMIIPRVVGGRLVQITLLADDASFGKGWDDYTEENEQKRRAIHDAFLVSALGPAQKIDDEHFYKEWTLPWGRVLSSHDPRGGTTDIQILYT